MLAVQSCKGIGPSQSRIFAVGRSYELIAFVTRKPDTAACYDSPYCRCLMGAYSASIRWLNTSAIIHLSRPRWLFHRRRSHEKIESRPVALPSDSGMNAVGLKRRHITRHVRTVVEVLERRVVLHRPNQRAIHVGHCRQHERMTLGKKVEQIGQLGNRRTIDGPEHILDGHAQLDGKNDRRLLHTSSLPAHGHRIQAALTLAQKPSFR